MNLTDRELEVLAEALVESHDDLLEKLVKLRKDHHLTQAQVAEMMGVSQPTVAAFERYDANPTLSTVRRYALAVGASVRHDVEDACCALSAVDSFKALADANKSWRPAAPIEWEWSAGPAVGKAFVSA